MPDPHVVARERVLTAVQSPSSVVGLRATDLDLTLRLLRRVRLLGRLAWHLRGQGVLEALPDAAQDQLQSALAMVEARERVARWEVDCLARALADAPVGRVVLMKGCGYLLSGLPNAAGRLFADVDLLVEEGEIEAVESHLRQRGWSGAMLTPYDDRYYRRWTHELPPMRHVEREVEVDLHHNVLMRTARLKPPAAALLAASVPLPGRSFHVLDPVDMTLHAITHLFYGGELDDALRDLVDIDELLRHFGAVEPGFWTRFWPRARALDLAQPAFLGLRYPSRLLGTPVPPPVMHASSAGSPPALVLEAMDRLVPHALFPPHPDWPRRRIALSRLLLFMRSHWVKMPPLLLARHLGYKFYLRYLRRTPPDGTT